jgi:formylglycine-generating enzyme required for sulfatase activity
MTPFISRFRFSFAGLCLAIGATLAVFLTFNALAGGDEENSRAPAAQKSKTQKAGPKVVEIESRSNDLGISTIEIVDLTPGQDIVLRVIFEDGREMIRKMKVSDYSISVKARLAGKGGDMNGLTVRAKPEGTKVKINGQEAKEKAAPAIAEAKPVAPKPVEAKPAAPKPAPLKAEPAPPAPKPAPIAKEAPKVVAKEAPRSAAPLPASAIKPGEVTSDCPTCPELVAVPTGEFDMGAPSGSFATDAPLRSVAITKPFSIGRQEITFAQWEACVADGGCSGYAPSDEGWGRETRPAINVSWNDAQRYLEWLSKKTGKKYRLPTEAEWEYAARAGSKTTFWWGRETGKNNANCSDCGGGTRMTQPVASYRANPLGLYDTAGNVWEWTEDCYDEESYTKFDGYPQAVKGGASCYRVVRGGAWDMMSSGLQSFFRYSIEPGNRANNIGFRVVRED